MRNERSNIPSGLLALEYEQLKEEQRLRMSSRDNLVYANLVAVGAIGAASLQSGLREILFLLPPVGVILGWTHASNDRKIWEIGNYIRGTLSGNEAAKNAFGWESAHRSATGYHQRRSIQLSVILLAFCGPSIAALVANWENAIDSALAMAVLSLEAMAAVFLGYQILVNVDRRWEPSAGQTQ